MIFETWWFVTISLAVAWLMPLLGDRYFRAIENFFSRLAVNRVAAVVGIFMVVIAIRVAMIPRFPIPVPFVHDEFGYLLQADIFAHGRLAFPPHPMAPFLETLYVTFSPTYASMYPPAQPAVITLGQLLGHPWVGVLLSSAAMCALVLWMLQGWLPGRWALLAGVLFTFRIGILSYWMNSYWGGAVPAASGALVIGALPRYLKYARLRDLFLMTFGGVILANCRPLEGAICCIPIGVVVVARLWRRWNEGHRGEVRKAAVVFAILFIANLGFNLYYNWRVTTNPFSVPHAAYIKQYMSVLPFMWMKPLPPKNFSNPQFHNFYDVWVLHQYNGTWLSAKRITWKKLQDFEKFYLGTFLSLPLLALPWIFRDRRIRILLIQFVICVVGLLAVVWFLPHYAAPMIATFFALLLQCLRHLRRWRFRGRPVGIGLSRVIILFSMATIALSYEHVLAHPFEAPYFDEWQPHNWDRAEIVEKLERVPGQHLVLVRYAFKHNIHMEWVYNSADIDGSKIVWAREIPGMDLAPLLTYYHDRKVWVVEPDQPAVPFYAYAPLHK